MTHAVESKTQTKKEVHIRYRYELQGKPIVVYVVRSSDGTQDYQVTLYDGRVCSCTCPAWGGHCYHRDRVQAHEDARTAHKSPSPIGIGIGDKGTLSSIGKAFSLLA